MSQSQQPLAHTSNITHCAFYARGSCRYGQDCRFLHQDTPRLEGIHSLSVTTHDTQYMIDTTAPFVKSSIHGVFCKFWQHGNCKRGDSCFYRHSQPDAENVDNIIPIFQDSPPSPSLDDGNPIEKDFLVSRDEYVAPDGDFEPSGTAATEGFEQPQATPPIDLSKVEQAERPGTEEAELTSPIPASNCDRQENGTLLSH